MTRISADRVYETAVEQIERVSGSSGWFGLSGTLRSDSNQTNPTNETNRTDQKILSGYTIFLDRDGTLNPDPGYINSPDQFELFPGVPGALARLQRAGARLIVVTNQSGIARGFLTRDGLRAVHMKLKRLLDAADVSLDSIYFCPHHPDDGCDCRKPNRGMIDQAVRERGVNLHRAYLIGDHIRDIELAKRIGARSILVTTGTIPPQEAERLKTSGPTPDWIASSLSEAADWLLSDASK
jgi:heptosyltransferase-2